MPLVPSCLFDRDERRFQSVLWSTLPRYHPNCRPAPLAPDNGGVSEEIRPLDALFRAHPEGLHTVFENRFTTSARRGVRCRAYSLCVTFVYSVAPTRCSLKVRNVPTGLVIATNL